MPECAKIHLQQSRISKFSGGGPPDPHLQGEGKGGRGKGRIGKGGEGREGTGQGGREGRNGVWWEGEGRSTWAPPPKDKLWIRPWLALVNMRFHHKM